MQVRLPNSVDGQQPRDPATCRARQTGTCCVGVSAAYDWSSSAGSLGQLGVNLGGILLAGTVTLAIQRALFERRRRRHVRELELEPAGEGRSGAAGDRVKRGDPALR
jgi:hypothetical protein